MTSRRQLCSLLGVSLALGACAADGPSRASHHAFAQDWLLVYWLPYDNDLAFAAPAVLGALEDARTAPGAGRVEVIAQVDLPGDAGMTRVRLGPHGRRDTVLTGHDGSARVAELGAFLDDVARSTDARRVMLAILGHAGHLEELSPDDDDSGPGPGASWMRLDDLAPVVEGFRARLRGELELVYLQSCAKASVEVVYELRGSARTLLASQAPLGAPNAYYGGAVAALRAVPTTDGPGLAEVIASSESPDMFVSLSLVDLSTLDALPELVDAAAAASSEPIPARQLAAAVFVDAGDALIDATALLAVRRARASATPHALDALADFLARDAVLWVRTSPAPAPGATVRLPLEGAPSGLWIRLTDPTRLPARSPFTLVRETRLPELASVAPL